MRIQWITIINSLYVMRTQYILATILDNMYRCSQAKKKKKKERKKKKKVSIILESFRILMWLHSIFYMMRPSFIFFPDFFTPTYCCGDLSCCKVMFLCDFINLLLWIEELLPSSTCYKNTLMNIFIENLVYLS